MSAKRIAYLGLLLALAVLFGYVESLIPVNLAIPGIKLGLANIVIVAVLYIFTWKEALAVSVLRVVIIGFMFGNLFSIAFGLSGTVLSVIWMALLKDSGHFGIVGLSAFGGVMHNIGQLAAAALIVEGFPFLWYLPILMLAGLLAGILIGAVSLPVMKRLPRINDF